ncbi:MAG: hypothetical protein K8S56_04275, partial [Candidatus Cloacimonetes bacterium]|nr:hypothetical protein [Candidatus Cloacimonadota bacterium]
MRYTICMRKFIVIEFLLIVAGQLFACTIGVASEKATADGRPLLWKTRDRGSHPNNKIYYSVSDSLSYIAVTDQDEPDVWMGMNEAGFAILNSTSTDLNQYREDDGVFMRIAVGRCSTVEEFEAFLIETNGERNTYSNFGAIDALGNAAIFETGSDEYWRFDADSTDTGYLIRTNFSVNGGGTSGTRRFERSQILLEDFAMGDSLTHRSILRYQMRDFADSAGNAIDIPYASQWQNSHPFGYIETYGSICGPSNVSAVVFRGVLPVEPPVLTTMWTILGHPSAAIALPYWCVGAIPPEANCGNTAPLCDFALQLKDLLYDNPLDGTHIDTYKLVNENSTGFWQELFASEDSLFTVTENLLDIWRVNTPSNTEVELAMHNLAEEGMLKLMDLPRQWPIIADFEIEQNNGIAPAYLDFYDTSLHG